MLQSGIDNSSESVYLDILTYADLERIKGRSQNSTFQKSV